jgi:signal transduction histidine kinase
MDTIAILLVLVIILTLAVLMLYVRIRSIRKSLANMLLVLEDIEKGNENRKILAGAGDAAADVCYKINAIVKNNKSRIIELEEAEKGYKRLLTSLSHDVRTPLTSLIGYLDAIRNNVVTGAEKDGYIEIARNKAYYLKDFVDMLFEWFKLDSGERTFHFEDTDVNELTRSILADWIPVFDKNGIALHADIPETECSIPLDIGAYTRMIGNIIQNSLLHGGGDRLDIGIMQKDDSVRINIADNGKGIAKKDMPYIFDRLYKCDEARSQKGNGLGLSIVKELAAAHSGTVSAASVPGEKTTFTITLPVKTAL